MDVPSKMVNFLIKSLIKSELIFFTGNIEICYYREYIVYLLYI